MLMSNKCLVIIKASLKKLNIFSFILIWSHTCGVISDSMNSNFLSNIFLASDQPVHYLMYSVSWCHCQTNPNVTWLTVMRYRPVTRHPSLVTRHLSPVNCHVTTLFSEPNDFLFYNVNLKYEYTIFINIIYILLNIIYIYYVITR